MPLIIQSSTNNSGTATLQYDVALPAASPVAIATNGNVVPMVTSSGSTAAFTNPTPNWFAAGNEAYAVKPHSSIADQFISYTGWSGNTVFMHSHTVNPVTMAITTPTNLGSISTPFPFSISEGFDFTLNSNNTVAAFVGTSGGNLAFGYGPVGANNALTSLTGSSANVAAGATSPCPQIFALSVSSSFLTVYRGTANHNWQVFSCTTGAPVNIGGVGLFSVINSADTKSIYTVQINGKGTNNFSTIWTLNGDPNLYYRSYIVNPSTGVVSGVINSTLSGFFPSNVGAMNCAIVGDDGTTIAVAVQGSSNANVVRVIYIDKVARTVVSPVPGVTFTSGTLVQSLTCRIVVSDLATGKFNVLYNTTSSPLTQIAQGLQCNLNTGSLALDGASFATITYGNSITQSRSHNQFCNSSTGTYGFAMISATNSINSFAIKGTGSVNTSLSADRYIGLTRVANTAGTNNPIQLRGSVLDVGLPTLTPGVVYYSDNNNSFTTASSTGIKLGIALTASSLLITGN